MFKKFLFYCSFGSLIVFYACEDDPLLGPQVSDCAPGDSYCEISLPGDKKDSKINNPETF